MMNRKHGRTTIPAGVDRVVDAPTGRVKWPKDISTQEIIDGFASLRGEESSRSTTYSIVLPKITEVMIEDFYPWLIQDDGDGYSWNQAAVDFACLLKEHLVIKVTSDD